MASSHPLLFHCHCPPKTQKHQHPFGTCYVGIQRAPSPFGDVFWSQTQDMHENLGEKGRKHNALTRRRNISTHDLLPPLAFSPPKLPVAPHSLLPPPTHARPIPRLLVCCSPLLSLSRPNVEPS
ncbi:unnamed protein product [Pleuronectes platessa]|uniref:Uncharacterized protein n=1 Tax=Pleuronectes platessa TaxID=8262 RepID=A0A9N7YC01_PLEPL|nr:unnamed protein product [Pleuronectes platessa]